ncbi:MAG TPA: hypothetical protein PK867_12535 [Pirellulales bacterium]|nr:hypothetical protein [Pirellulales bacterium]
MPCKLPGEKFLPRRFSAAVRGGRPILKVDQERREQHGLAGVRQPDDGDAAQVGYQRGKGCGHFGIVLLRRAWLRHLDDNDRLWPAWQTIIQVVRRRPANHSLPIHKVCFNGSLRQLLTAHAVSTAYEMGWEAMTPGDAQRRHVRALCSAGSD